MEIRLRRLARAVLEADDDRGGVVCLGPLEILHVAHLVRGRGRGRGRGWVRVRGRGRVRVRVRVRARVRVRVNAQLHA